MSSTPASPGETASTAFTDSTAGQEFAGKAVSLPWPLELTPVNLTSMDSRNIEENLRRITNFLRPFGGRIPELYNVARFFGMAHVTGAVQLAIGTAGDVRFPHDLGRIPRMVVFSIDLNGTGGQIRAGAAGGQGGAGGNNSAWTKTDLFVRATITSDYSFLVI